ncbi:hypothetical protein [Streptomyces sp. NPDC001340]
MAELARCIDEHNTLTRQARDLWGRAEAESRRIGELVKAVLSTGVSWTELGTLLTGIDDAPPPAALIAGGPSSAAPTAEKNGCEEEPGARRLVPTQSPGANPRTVAGGLVPEGIPVLLFQAHAVVSASADQEMATRDLAAALGRNPNSIGPDLCALLREVDVDRPNDGKIKARYPGNGKRLPGFTAACLQQALDAYAARASDSPTTPA